jgi:hypothetical protein
MNAAAVQIEAAQMGLVQRAQKYEGQAALKLIEGATSNQPQSAAPPPSSPPVQPVSASPREGSTLHVIA